MHMNGGSFRPVIVGGGTAGWITALTIQQHYPDSSVTLIQSKDIGILGAGEGITPGVVLYLNQIGIQTSDIIKHANGTFKNGIKFTNWNGDNKFFYHSFGVIDDLNSFVNTSINQCKTPLIALEKIAEGDNLNSVDLSAMASENKNVTFLVNTDINNKESNPLFHFNNVGHYALHFNAEKLANYLESVGKSRGIKIIEGTVNKIITNTEEYITSLKLDNGKTISTNFVFDCTGFKRLIIGNLYKSEWKSYKDYLPVNRAITFTQQLTPLERIPPYTEAIAMKYGWTWKIPVQDRYGCGYVFDKNQVSDEDAKKEINSYAGVDMSTSKIFSFEPGSYQRTWIKNCIALGISAGFVEPLEATSIWTTTAALKTFLNNIKGVFNKDQNLINDYNDKINLFNENVLSFLYFHYLTKREDTLFWKNFTKHTKTPVYIDYLAKNNNDVQFIFNDYLNNNVFSGENWVQVGIGIQFFNKKEAEKSLVSYLQGPRKTAYYFYKEKLIRNLNLTASGLLDHRGFLQYLINT